MNIRDGDLKVTVNLEPTDHIEIRIVEAFDDNMVSVFINHERVFCVQNISREQFNFFKTRWENK
jgi:hypothetical protein